MDLDNLKELWDKDHNETPEISLDEKKRLHSPLHILKINMRIEFCLLIITLPTLLWDVTWDAGNDSIRYISIFTVSLVFLLMMYFYSKFLKLYKMLSYDSINTNYDLFKLRTQLLVSKEIYTSYLISYIPLSFVLSLIKINFHFDDKYNIIVFGFSFLITLAIILLFIRYWLYYMYGRYINDVVDLVDELNGVEITNNKPKKNTRFLRTEQFLIQKLGIAGNILNIVLWFFIYYTLIILIMAIIIIIATFVGAQLNYIDLNTMIKTLDNM